VHDHAVQIVHVLAAVAAGGERRRGRAAAATAGRAHDPALLLLLAAVVGVLLLLLLLLRRQVLLLRCLERVSSRQALGGVGEHVELQGELKPACAACVCARAWRSSECVATAESKHQRNPHRSQHATARRARAPAPVPQLVPRLRVVVKLKAL
jgi:hypothetical protein